MIETKRCESFQSFYPIVLSNFQSLVWNFCWCIISIIQLFNYCEFSMLMEDMLPVISICMLRQRDDFWYPFCGCSILWQKEFLALQQSNNEITYLLLQEILWSTLTFFLLGCFQMLWLQLSVHMMVYSDVFHGMHSPLVKVCLNLIEVFDCEGYHWCCFKYVSECIIDN